MPSSTSTQVQSNSLEVSHISVLQLPSAMDLLASKDMTTYLKELHGYGFIKGQTFQKKQKQKT